MSVAQVEILDKIASMTVLELSELIKAMEEKFGVSAAAAVAVAAPAAAAAAAAGRRADRVHRDADRDRREQGQRDQGGARADRPRPEGSQGPGRRRAEGRQGSACRRPTPKPRRRSSKKPARRSTSSNTGRASGVGRGTLGFPRSTPDARPTSSRRRRRADSAASPECALLRFLKRLQRAGMVGQRAHRHQRARCRPPAVGSGQPPSRGAQCSRNSR